MTEIRQVDYTGKSNKSKPLPAKDPIALAGITVKAVDQIGEAAAVEIDDVATALEHSAKEIGDKLRDLAKAVREHSRIASEHVAEFCDKSTSVVETIRTLQRGLEDIAEPNGKDHE